jgi:hypothetical protein
VTAHLSQRMKSTVMHISGYKLHEMHTGIRNCAHLWHALRVAFHQRAASFGMRACVL